MNLRRIYAFIIFAGVFLTIIMPAGVFAALPAISTVNNPLSDCVEFTPKTGIFHVGGQEFILLSSTKDDNSKFLVMTRDTYGNKNFDDDNTQKFDPEDSNNIAHWLNNGFLEAEKTLPKEIVDHINKDAEWETEGGHASGNTPVGNTVTCGISLLSQTEYNRFYPKFGIRDNMTLQDQAWWLRSPFASGAGNNIIIVCKVSDPVVTGRTIQWPANRALPVRPVFYLNKDFFKNVKVNAHALGVEVKKAMLKQYTVDELLEAGYSDEEIKMIQDITVPISENIDVRINNLELGNMLDPAKADFTVDFAIGGSEDKKYMIEFSVEALGIPKTFATLTVKPRIQRTPTLSLKGIKNGIGTLNVKITDGDRVAYQFSKEVYVMPPYVDQFMDTFNEHCMGTHYPQPGQSDEKDTVMMVRSGVKSFRDSVLWNAVETKKGVFDFAWLDRFVPVLHEQGITQTAIVGLNNTLYMPQAPTTSDDLDAFLVYLNNILDRYPFLRQIEIWNEPNLRSFWRPDPYPYEYMKVMKAATMTIRKKNPAIKILGGSINGTDPRFTSGMYDLGAFPYMDSVSFHPYITPSTVDERYRENTEKMLKTIYDYGGWKDPFVTEIGWPTHDAPTGNSEEKQALEIMKMYIVADSMNITGNAVYSFKDSGNNPRENEDRFGLIRRDLTPKKSYLTLSQLNRALGGALYFGEMYLPGNINAHVYRKNGAPLIAMWTTEGETTFTFDTNKVICEDLLGNPIAVSENGTIDVGRDIIYVTGLGNHWFNKTLSMYTGSKYQQLIDLWQGKIPEDKIEGLKNLKAYVYEVGAKTSMPSEKEISDKITQNYQIGSEMIQMLKEGTSPITELETAQFLFYLHRTGEQLGTILGVVGSGSGGVPSQRALKDFSDTMRVKSSADLDAQYQYTEAMLRYARTKSDDAQRLYLSSERNPGKDGVIKTWDRIASELIGWSRLFLEFEDPSYTSFMMEVPIDDTNIYTKENKNINVGVRNFSEHTVNATIKLFDLDGNLVAENADVYIAANSLTRSNLGLYFENTFPNNMKDFVLKLYSGDKLLDFTQITFRTKDKYKVQLVPTSNTVDKIKSVTYKLTSIYTKPINGTIKVKPPKGWTLTTDTATFSMDPLGEALVTFQVSNTAKIPFNMYMFDTTVNESTSADPLIKSVPLSITNIVKNTKETNPADYKGNISDWADAYPFYIDPPGNASSAEEWQKSEASGIVYTKWDDDYFYVMASYYDDDYAQKSTGGSMWGGDSIQFSIDTLNNKSTSYDLDDFEWGMGFTQNGIEVFLYSMPPAFEGGIMPSEWCSIVRDDAMHLTRYLIRIPKEYTAPLPLRAGTKIGFNLGLNDADTTTRERHAQLTSGTTDNKNPSLYETFVLGAAESALPLDNLSSFNIPVDMDINYDNNFKYFWEVTLAERQQEDDPNVKPNFVDLEGHWGKDEIYWMVDKGYLSGVSKTMFEPERAMTRAEFLSLVSRAHSFPRTEFTELYNDVRSSDWYAAPISDCYNRGVLPAEMAVDGNFLPNQPITREEVSAILVRAYHIANNTTVPKGNAEIFADRDKIASWALDDVIESYNIGFMNSMTTDTFAPKVGLTRAQGAVVVKRVVQKG